MEVRIGRAEYGGAFASSAGPSMPFVLPGELVEQGEPPVQGLVVLESAPGRIAPACVHFGACGGCHYQHADYGLQLALKQQLLAGVMADAGLRDLPPLKSLSGEPWGYRNRIRMRLRVGSGDAIEFGYSVAATNFFLPVQMCPIAAPLLWRAVHSLRRLGETDRRTREWLSAADEVELFCDGDENRLQVQLYLREAGAAVREPSGFAVFCEELRKFVPELAGAAAQLAPELSRRTRRSWAGVGWGSSGIQYDVAGQLYWVSRGAFFQVNRSLVGRLVELVASEAGGDGSGRAWDLYAGVGLFTRPLAAKVGRVLAVEGAEQAAADLVAGAQGGRGWAAYEAARMPTVDFLRQQQTQRERPDVVVLDPPRAGLGEEGAALLARLTPARIVYVSCDPVTLARDLRVLVASGYRVRAMHMVDLFPQTFHIETVVRLERVDAESGD